VEDASGADDRNAGSANGVAVAPGVGVRMITEGATLGFGLVLAGSAVGDVAADGAGDGDGDAAFSFFGRSVGFAAGDGLGVGDAIGDAVAGIALAPGSGVNVGALTGVRAPFVLPKNLVSRPPSSSPPRMTKITSGTTGTPPPRGGSGSKRRRRG
jgi:hypothetical protein